MIAFGFLVFLIGLWIVINTFNGNLPGMVDIPGIHDATTGIRGLTEPTVKPSDPVPAGSVSGLMSGFESFQDIVKNVQNHSDLTSLPNSKQRERS